MVKEEEETVIASDSKRYYRSWVDSTTGEKKEFFGCIATVISIGNIDQFVLEYDQIMTELFRDYCEPYSINRLKPVYSGYEIASLFPGRQSKSRSFIHNFAREIFKLENIRVSFFFTTLNSKLLKNSKVIINQEYSNPEEVDVKRFLNILTNYYNYIATWSFLEKTELRNQNILLDSFEGDITRAWLDLIEKNQVGIVYNGDSTLASISSSDLMTRWFEDTLNIRHCSLNLNSLRDLLDNTLPDKEQFVFANPKHVHWITNTELEYIVPITKKRIPIDLFLTHPHIFILKEGLEGEKNIIEKSKLMTKIQRKANELNAGIKFLDPKRDAIRIKDGDYFVWSGEIGESYYKLFRQYGYEINKLDL